MENKIDPHGEENPRESYFATLFRACNRRQCARASAMGLVKFLTHGSISPAMLRHHGGGTSPGTLRHDKRLASMKLDKVRRIKRDQVVLGELIGKGGFANVHKGQFDGQTVVCKLRASDQRLYEACRRNARSMLMVEAEHVHWLQEAG